MNDQPQTLLSSQEAFELHDVIFGHLWLNVSIIDFLHKQDVIAKPELLAHLEKTLAHLKKIGANENMLRHMDIYCNAIRTGRDFT